ncbi:NADH dehydrogenase subunit 5 [Rummeliibacillus sp. JY-2-4R]
MLNSFYFTSWQTIFFILIFVSLCSALIMLSPKVPLNFVRVHIGIVALPPIVALFALVFNNESVNIGPWHFDSLSWLWAMFVLTIGLIIQRYCVRYLFGDRSYRKYFALLTFTTVADAVAWLSDDLRLMALGWGITLLGLTMLIGLKKEWKVARQASALTARYFAISFLALLLAIVWLSQVTGHWELSQALTHNSLAQIDSWEKTCINLLLIIAVVIPASQWPAHRWLLDSVVAPTPISAIMHAGIVNVGSILLARFAPILNGDITQVILLVLCSVSVVIGTGIMLVQVDYKRQLVGSTIAQMGFMLIQCALGAYLAAITHAVLHGLFKSTLFLQAGSAAKYSEPIAHKKQPASLVWTVSGGILGLAIGFGYWLTAPEQGYQLVSALILGWSVSLAWTQLMASVSGRIVRLTGFMLFVVAAIVFQVIHTIFYNLLHDDMPMSSQTHLPLAILLLCILLVSSVIGTWLVRKRSKVSIAIYLWLVRLGEPKNNLVESHPKYLTQLLSRGGHLH